MKTINLDIKKFRVQVVSDIHMELRNHHLPIEVSAEILALCGDIGSPTQDSYWEIIKWANTNYKHVFLITGNHEYYHKELTMDEIDEHIKKNI
jgi:predicted phosphodiesterase